MANDYNKSNRIEEIGLREEERRRREEEERRRALDTSLGGQEFENSHVSPIFEQADINVSALQYTDNAPKGEATIQATADIGHTYTRIVQQTIDEQENEVEQGKKKMTSAMDIMSLALGNVTDANINSTYDKVMGSLGSVEAKKWMEEIGFAGDSLLKTIEEGNIFNNDNGVRTVDVRLENGTRLTIDQSHIDQYNDNGYFTIAGHTEQAAHTENRQYSFTGYKMDGGVSQVSYTYTDQNGETKEGFSSFSQDRQGNIGLTIDGHTFSEDIVKNSIAANEKANDYEYLANNSTKQGVEGMSNDEWKSKYSAMSDAWRQNSMVNAEFTTHETVDKRYNLSNAQVLDKNGAAKDLSAESLLNMNMREAGLNSATGAANGAAFQAAGAGVNPLTAHGGEKTANKALALQNLSMAGYQYLQNDKYLQGKLTKNADPVTRLKDVEKARRDLKGEINQLKKDISMAKANGKNREALKLSKELSEKEASIKKIDSFKRFGGDVTDFNTSRGLSAAQRRGLTVLRNATGIQNSDVAAPIIQTAATVNTVKNLVNTAGNAGARIRRHAAVKRESKAKKYDKKHGTNRAEAATKHREKLDYKARKEDAKRKGGDAWRNFRADEKLRGMDAAIEKANKKADEILKKDSDLVKKQQAKIEKAAAKGKLSGEKEQRLKDRAQAKRDRLESKRRRQENKENKEMDRKKAFEERRAKKLEKKQNRLGYKLREAWNNSRLGKIVNTITGGASALGVAIKGFFDGIEKIKKIAIGSVVALLLICIVIRPISYSLTTWLTSWFCEFEKVADLALDLVFPAVDRINYNQYVVDKTGYSLGSTFAKVCESDAKWHYLLDSVFSKYPTNTSSSGLCGSAKDVDWYKSIDEAELGKVWAREESDNTTVKVNEDGSASTEKAFASTYKPASEREDLENVNVNLMPILSMANARMVSEINFKNFRNVQAYCYYMFVASHDRAKYDDLDGDGAISGDEENGYKIYDTGFHNLNEITYDSNWDKHARVLNRGPEKGICKNVFYHGMSSDSYGLIGGVKLLAASFVDNLSLYLQGKSIGEYMTKIGTELCVKSGSTYKFSGNWKDASSTVYTVKHKKADGTTYNSSSAFLDDAGNVTCYHRKIFQWSDDEKACLKGQRNKFPGTLSPYFAAHGISEGNSYSGWTWGATTCGKESHDHSGGFIPGVCNTVNCGNTPEHTHGDGTCHISCGKTEHTHNGNCKTCSICGNIYLAKDAEGHYLCSHTEGHTYDGVVCTLNPCSTPEHTHTSACCDKVEHKHTQACCNLQHIHTNWTSPDSPGCWTSIFVCEGHCGGHLKASINVVVMNTWEGLMQLDNFKMCYYLRESCFSTFLEWDKMIFDLDVWMWFWNKKVHAWFNPFAQGLILIASPLDLFSWGSEKLSMALSEVGLFVKSGFHDALDNSSDADKANVEANKKAIKDEADKTEEAPADGDEDKEYFDEKLDIYYFKGWYKEGHYVPVHEPSGYTWMKYVNGGFEDSVLEMESLYGTPKDKWEEGRISWYSDIDDICVKFPSTNNVSDPGTYGWLKWKTAIDGFTDG